MKQLITGPTKTTPYSSMVIDLCFTNSPSKITNAAGIIELSINDHVLVHYRFASCSDKKYEKN